MPSPTANESSRPLADARERPVWGNPIAVTVSAWSALPLRILCWCPLPRKQYPDEALPVRRVRVAGEGSSLVEGHGALLYAQRLPSDRGTGSRQYGFATGDGQKP